MLFSIVAVSIYIPINVRIYPFSPYPLQHWSFVDFNVGHSDRCEVEPHCSFDFNFSNSVAERFFMCPLDIHMSSLEKCLFRFSAYFSIFSIGLFVFWFFFFLSCMSHLYILEIKPMLVALFAKTFSCFVGCLFVFVFMVSLAVQRFLSLIRSTGLLFSLSF